MQEYYEYKIITAIILGIIAITAILWCSNDKTINDSVERPIYTKAIVYINGEQQVYEIKDWKNFSDGELFITTTDGKNYLFNSYNTILTNE